RSAHLFNAGINVRKQPIALFNVVFANGFVLRPVYPYFLVRGSFCSVIAVNGIECSGLDPARQELWSWRSGKTANVIADHSVSGNAHVDEIFVQSSPPFARTRQSEIAEYAIAGPDGSHECCAIGPLDENVVLHAEVVGRIAVIGIFLDVQVGNQNSVKPLSS